MTNLLPTGNDEITEFKCETGSLYSQKKKKKIYVELLQNSYIATHITTFDTVHLFNA